MKIRRLVPVLLAGAALLVTSVGACSRLHECLSGCPRGERSATDLPMGDAVKGDAAGRWDLKPLDARGLERRSIDGRADAPISADCPASFSSAIVDVTFDHNHGTFSQLIYKPGCGKNIIATGWNTTNGAGLARLLKESGTTATCNIGASSFTIVYSNSALYTSKTLTLTTPSTGMVEIAVAITGVKTATQEGGLWMPGGANDTNDWARVRKADSSVQDFHYTYPGRYTNIWGGASLGIILWDAKCNEAFGYRYPAPGSNIWIGNGVAADGPYQNLAAGSSYSFTFAVGSRTAVEGWL